VTRLQALLGADAWALVERVGTPLAEAQILTRLPSPVMAHASFRLRFTNGRILKVRRVETAAQAERMQAILDVLDARHFPRILDRHAAALLEEWVAGEPLEPPAAPALASRCGAVLGAMHRVVPPAGIQGSSGDTARRLDQLERQAGELVRLGVLDPRAEARLLAIARAHAPGDIALGVIHRDFCAENIVLATPDRPWVVDNETVRIDACDFDLARTWYRWPMTEAEETAFLEGYAWHRSPHPYLKSFPFWALCVLADTALFRQRARTPEATVPLDRLEALLREPTSLRPGRPGSSARVSRGRADHRQARGFRYPGLTIRVECTEPRHLRWLDEFLVPAFERAEDVAWDRRVVLDTDPERYAETLGRGPSPSGARPVCFVLDGRAVVHPEWKATGPERVVFDESYRAFYCLRPANGDVRVLTEGGVGRSRVALMRVVRELAMSTSIEGGGLLLHAAAFACGEQGVVLAGPKAAGKTTLLLHALAAGKAHFVSNDRVLVSLDDGGARVRGLPTMVAVQPGTLALFPDLAARATSYRHHLTIAEAAAAGLPSRPGRPASLTPAQLCDEVGRAARAEAPLRRILFPCLDPGADAIRLEPLDHAAAAQRLTAALFGAEAPGRVSEVFSSGSRRPVVDPLALQGLCGALAARVPCYVCRLPPGRCAEPDVAGALLA
jgi:Ser/Thr protein kinase RdoA (MazF antagonist)